METLALMFGIAVMCVGPALLIAMATYSLTRRMFIKSEYAKVIRLSDRRKRSKR